MITPKISIITASYNYAHYISQTIESVINQTYSNWELIIVDDGSTDNSVDIIKNFCAKDGRIKLYQHKGNKNKGLKKTVQLGLKMATCEWVAFLESDDAWTENYLEEKIKVINENSDVKFIFNDYGVIGNEDMAKASWHVIFHNDMNKRYGFSDYRKDFYKTNPVPTFSIVMLKKELFKNVNFGSPISQCLDWFLWGQISNKTRFFYINKPLTYWRKHPNSYFNRTKKYNYFLFYLILGFYLPDIYIKKFKRIMLIFSVLN